MHSFKDRSGHEWQVSLDTQTLLDLRKEGLNLLKIDRDSPIAKAEDDPVWLCSILWQLVGSQAPTLTEEHFRRAMGGDSLTEGFEALLDELSDFFPPLRQTIKVGRRLRKVAAAEKGDLLTAMGEVESLDELIRLVRPTPPPETAPTEAPEAEPAQPATTPSDSGTGSGTSPESAESIPAP
jgi:hypothetical protein